MTEAELLESVVELAKVLGVFVWHAHDSRRSEPGFPDLVLAGKRGLIFAELKSRTGRLSGAQICWRYRLQMAGQRWYLWRPVDWHSRAIELELRSIA